MPPKLNGWKGLCVSCLAGLFVAVAGGIGLSRCEYVLSLPGFDDKIAHAQATAEAAHDDAEALRLRVRANEKSIAALHPKVENIDRQTQWLVNNLYPYMRQRGGNPEPPPEEGAP